MLSTQRSRSGCRSFWCVVHCLLLERRAVLMQVDAAADAARASSGQACSCAPPSTAYLQQHRVSGVQDVFYLPDYLCAAEEDSLASAIRASKQRWTQARRSSEDVASNLGEQGV